MSKQTLSASGRTSRSPHKHRKAQNETVSLNLEYCVSFILVFFAHSSSPFPLLSGLISWVMTPTMAINTFAFTVI